MIDLAILMHRIRRRFRRPTAPIVEDLRGFQRAPLPTQDAERDAQPWSPHRHNPLAVLRAVHTSPAVLLNHLQRYGEWSARGWRDLHDVLAEHEFTDIAHNRYRITVQPVGDAKHDSKAPEAEA